MKITLIGLDIAKSVFHLHAVNRAGRQVKRKKLRRKEVLNYMRQLEPCRIVMEACGSAHFWAREFQSLGHEVALIAPQYVTPYRQGNKNDYNDAQAIAEAAQRPKMRYASIKTIEQQDIQVLHRIRERLVKQCTALVNQVRGMLAEYGVVIPQGKHSFRRELPCILEDAENQLTSISRELFSELYDEFLGLEQRIELVQKKIEEVNSHNPICQRLDGIPGIGPLTATAIYAAIGLGNMFKNGRHLSAFFGLAPKHRGSGDRNTIQGISKRGNSYVRTLLIHGARSVLLHSINKTDPFSLWAQALKERRGFNKASVAIANKLARFAWVVTVKEVEYRQPV